MDQKIQLCEGLDRLGIPWNQDQLNLLLRYRDELLLWNPTHGLIGGEGGSRETPSDLIPRHFLDSLAPWPILRPLSFRTILDVGSGAGFPGIPLALFFPEARVVLVEKQKRRCDFLKNVVALLGLTSRVRVEQRAMENLSETFDLVTLRAFAALPRVYGELKRLTAPGGKIAAYKGTRENGHEEMEGMKGLGVSPEGMTLIPLKVPFLEAERHLLLLDPWCP